ncbi:hypothetical protein [Aliiroseovarius pelagivivens]|uniref:hypothetical protein n=1 Tax=Aliiroseovarius pelagivivens TaxID=1639690 RepID=UPI000D561D9A|nr:hypothetical protein [Aliiroseovarius pelagivivens]
MKKNYTIALLIILGLPWAITTLRFKLDVPSGWWEIVLSLIWLLAFGYLALKIQVAVLKYLSNKH